MDAWQFIERVAHRASIAHHIPGRVRLKFDLGAIEGARLRDVHPESLRLALENIRGVASVRLNALARSCTVEYDEKVIPRAAWEDLLACRKSAAAEILLEILHAKYREAVSRV